MGNRAENRVGLTGKLIVAGRLLFAGGAIGAAGIAIDCGGGGSDTSTSPTANVLRTESPMPSETAMATQLTESPTPVITEAPTIAPTPEPTPVPEGWSDEEIAAQIDSALNLADTLSQLNPGSEFFDTILTQAKAGQTDYNHAIETKDYSSILTPLNEFSSAGNNIGNFACHETYREVEGTAWVEFRDLVFTLSSKYESLGYLEDGMTQTFKQLFTLPEDCTNTIMLSSNN